MTACFVTINASASEGMSFAGTACRAEGTYDAYASSNGYTYANTSTGNAYVSCPVAFDRSATNVLFGNLRVYDGSTSASVSCTFYARDEDGTLIDSITKSTSSAGTGASLLAFYDTGMGGPYNGLDVDGAYYAYFRCYLPGSATSSKVYQFEWFIP